jgi:hypothetical protein
MSDSNNPIPIGQKEEKKETWTEWGGRYYNDTSTNWKPWLEDKYLQWFGKDNKASYSTKRKMNPPFLLLQN